MADPLPVSRYFEDRTSTMEVWSEASNGTRWAVALTQCERCAALVLDGEEQRRKHVEHHLHTDQQARSIVRAGGW